MALDRKIYVRIGSLGSDRQADSCCVLLSSAVTDLDARVSTLEATVSNILPTVEAAAATATAAAATATAAESAAVAAAADATAAAASAAGEAARFLLPAASDPTTRDNGDPLQDGDNYLNTVDVEVRVYNGGTWTNPAAATTFLQLTDAPASYAGQAGKFVRVKGDESGLEFAAGGGGGGGTVRDWDLTPTSVPATLELFDLPGVPFPNEGVVVGDNLSVPVAGDSTPHFGSALLGTMPTAGKVYVYWRPNPDVGPIVGGSVQGFIVGTLAANVVQFSYAGGLVITVGSGGSVMVDAAFAQGDTACFYFDIDTGSVGAKTSNGDFPALATGLALASGGVVTATYAAASGPASLSVDLGTTDFSGALPPPATYSALMDEVDAPLPVGSAVGDFLNVTVAGSWNAIPYSLGDGATVTSVTPAAVTPAGTTAAALAAGLATKLSPPTYALIFTAEVGAGKAYANLDALKDHIAANALSGDLLTVDLYPGAVDALAGANVDFRFPTFKMCSILAGGAASGSFDFGAETVLFNGSASNLFLLGALTLTTTSNFIGSGVVFGAASVNCAGLELHGFHTSATSFTQSSGGSPVFDGMLAGFGAASLSFNFSGGGTSGSVYATVTGQIGYLAVTANVRAYAESGTAAGLTWNYTGGDLVDPLNPVVMVSGGGHCHVAQINYGTANVDTAIAVQNGGIASIYDVGGANIIGTGTLGRKFSQGPNVGTYNGLIMADAPWIAPTLLNGWTNIAGKQVAQYRRIGDRVEMRFSLENGTAGGLFTLPAGNRPPADLECVIGVNDNTGTPDLGHLLINADGTVVLEHPGVLSNHKVYGSCVAFSVTP